MGKLFLTLTQQFRKSRLLCHKSQRHLVSREANSANSTLSSQIPVHLGPAQTSLQASKFKALFRQVLVLTQEVRIYKFKISHAILKFIKIYFLEYFINRFKSSSNVRQTSVSYSGNLGNMGDFKDMDIGEMLLQQV